MQHQPHDIPSFSCIAMPSRIQSQNMPLSAACLVAHLRNRQGCNAVKHAQRMAFVEQLLQAIQYDDQRVWAWLCSDVF
jgi:hypothetical protein